MPLQDTMLRLAEDPAPNRLVWSCKILAEARRTLESKFHIEVHPKTWPVKLL